MASTEVWDAHLVLEAEEARPAAEHERVVGGDDGDDVDALCLALVVLLKDRREVVRVAGGLGCGVGGARGRSRRDGGTHGERAGDGDEDDLLALPLVRAQLRRCARRAAIALSRAGTGEIVSDRAHRGISLAGARTDAARGVVLELGGVGDVGEGARGDGVADLDAGHGAWRGVCAGLEGRGGDLARER